MTDVLEATGINDSAALITAAHGATLLRSSGVHPSVRVESDSLGSVVLGRTTYGIGMHVEVHNEPLRVIYVACMRHGQVSYRQQRDERRYGPGDVFFAAQPDTPVLSGVDSVDIDHAIIEPNLLSEVAQPGPRDRQPIRLLDHRPLSVQAGEWWWRTYRALRDIVAAEAMPAQPPDSLVVTSAARLLAAVTLTTFPNTSLSDPTIEDRHDAHPDTVRRAVAFIEANPHHPLTVTHIAAAAFVSVRAVQLAFRRHLDTTPMAYLQRVRLDRVHRDLMAADPTRTTVTAIANQWGFAHLSRFAGLYRKTYGHPPSHTLHN